AEQEGRLLSPVSHQCRNASRSRPRSPTSRCRNREARTSSACTLRAARRWTLCRLLTLDQTPLRLLSSRRSTESRLPQQVPQGTQTRLRERPTQLSWRLEAPRSTENLCCMAQAVV